MKKSLLLCGGFLLAVLVGRYMIPSGSVASKEHTANSSRSATTLPSAVDNDEDAVDSGGQQKGFAVPGDTGVDQRGTGVFVNRRELSQPEVTGLAAVYHQVPPAGHYWYDRLSGAWGLEGHETAGFLMPGHQFGPLAADASAGNTGVFVNGRQINTVEAMRIQQNLGAVYRGRWWLDGRTGNFGEEGNPMAMGNLSAAVRARRNSVGGDNFWCSTTACGNDDGHTGYVDVGGTIVSYDH